MHRASDTDVPTQQEHPGIGTTGATGGTTGATGGVTGATGGVTGAGVVFVVSAMNMASESAQPVFVNFK